MPKPLQKSLLEELAAIPSELFTRGFAEQNAAICYRRSAKNNDIEVLLLTSRDTGRWIVPKGWPMKGKKPHRAAAIEAWEEAGVIGKVHKKPFGCFTYVKKLDGGSHRPVTVRTYLLRVKNLDKSFREAGQRRLEWMSPLEAARRVREPELKTMLVGLEKHLISNSSRNRKHSEQMVSS